MTLSIEQLRAAFKQQENEGSRPNNYYPFWNMEEGASAQIRFLPDANAENPLGFLVEKLMHTLNINGETKSVPCLKMYGEECPICKVSSAYYKDDDKNNGKKYWRKKQHIAQVLVVQDPLPPDGDTGETHAGKVRFIALGYQLFNIMKDAFESGELEEVPFSFKGGTDFIIKKTRQGEHASYVIGTKFDRRAYDLSDDQIAHVKEQMIDLRTLLPQHPGVEKVEAMLEASLTGSNYSDNRDSSSSDAKVAESVSSASSSGKGKSTEEQDKEQKPADATPSEFDDEADEILAQIRARAAKKAQ